MKKNKKSWPWIFLSLFIIACDQWTKHLVLEHVTRKTVIPVFPFLNFILRVNPGAAFSFLGNANGWQVYLLSGMSIVISALLIVWLCRLSRVAVWTALPVSLVLGGALGNLIDRVQFGYVIDFIDVHFKGWHYATFNIADSAVSVGAVWLVLKLFFEMVSGTE